MSNVIYHYPEPEKMSLAEKVIYNFITAAELLGIMYKCDDCKICQDACKRIKEIEKEARKDDNKMD